jgi:putative ABC transport system permease protein
MDLESLQRHKNMHGNVSKVLVSALTKPMDEFAYRDPDKLSQVEFEKWYCTGYVTSIARQLEEVFSGSSARPVWQIAQTEGKILEKLTMLIYFLSFIVLAAAALGVSTTMVMSLLRRTEEIGLMKAIGADRTKVITIFLSEGVIIGLIGGLLGYALSIAVSEYIGMEVFNTGFRQRGMLMPIAIGSAVLISVSGTILPIRKALSVKPAVVLKGAE